MSDSEDARSVGGDDVEEKKELEDVRNPDVVTKYKLASEICQRGLETVLAMCKPGASVLELCKAGDNFIVQETDKVFKGKKVTKGVGFPTCVSPNHVVGSFSPMPGDETKLAEGDMVTVDMGVQIDGYLSQAAHTVIVGGGAAEGRKADVMAAVFNAADAVTRMMRPGTSNAEITKVVVQTAKDFGVSCIENIGSHVVKRFEIEGDKKIDNSIPEVPPTGENKTKPCTLEANEVWAIDVVMSTGNGRPRQVDERTTVFRRAVDKNYQLKLKASRAVFGEISKKFNVFPFSCRSLEAEAQKISVGTTEASKHGLLEAYPVLHEKEGDFVAHVKFTIMLTPTGTVRLTGYPYNETATAVKSEKKPVSEEVVKALGTAIFGKKKKKRSNKKKKKATE